MLQIVRKLWVLFLFPLLTIFSYWFATGTFWYAMFSIFNSFLWTLVHVPVEGKESRLEFWTTEAVRWEAVTLGEWAVETSVWLGIGNSKF